MFKVDNSFRARNFTPHPSPRAIRLIVIHTTENQEASGVARNVAAWFAGPNAPQASAHYVIDDLEVFQVVDDRDIAWAAPGANADGLHLEHAGMAGQTPEEWEDAYSNAELRNSADLARALCEIYEIPTVKLTVEQVADGQSKGICGHVDVSNAFPNAKGSHHHTDPGPHFPWDAYMRLVTGEE